MENWQQQLKQFEDSIKKNLPKDTVLEHIENLKVSLDKFGKSYNPKDVKKDFNDGNEIVIKSYNLSKTYGAKKANDSVFITVRKGSIYGLIGRNGAGKTTFMKMLLGISAPTSGKLKVFGKEVKENKPHSSKVGFIVESPSFYGKLSAYDNLRHRAILLGIKDFDAEIMRVLSIVGIADIKKQKVRSMSLGQKQLLGLAQALMGDPELLVLDEPINGLDPIVIVEIRRIFKELSNEGKTIIVSSHILKELEQTATCYGFMLNGKLVREISEKEAYENVFDLEKIFLELAEEE